MFQSYSRFPERDAAANMSYPLRLKGRRGAEVTRRVGELLDLVGLADQGTKYPGELSGGQQQRVALARALATAPDLLLLDEPLSALDPGLRAQLRTDIRALQRSLGIPTIMVTHDRDEALSMADTIIYLRDGRIEQAGTPRDLYERPRSRFVADFIGRANLLPTSFVRDALPGFLERRPPGGDGTFELCLRPEDLVIHADPRGEATIEDVTFLGNHARAALAWRGRRLIAELPGHCTLSRGETVAIDATRGAWVCA